VYVFTGTEGSQSSFSSVSLTRTLNFTELAWNCPHFRAANQVYSYLLLCGYTEKIRLLYGLGDKNSAWRLWSSIRNVNKNVCVHVTSRTGRACPTTGLRRYSGSKFQTVGPAESTAARGPNVFQRTRAVPRVSMESGWSKTTAYGNGTQLLAT